MPSVIVFFPFGEFQPDGPFELEVLRLVYHANTSTTKLLKDPVLGHGLAYHGTDLHVAIG
jgi:hypothetical protein